jgi:60 kDa SS-A/Ro ribonucleoprotein
MSMRTYTGSYNTKKTSQTEKVPGKKQSKNNAGGFVFELDDWKRLDRFLILGTEGGTYYVTEKALTKANAECVVRCIRADGVKTVERIVEISDAGRAPKNDPAIFALAMCLKMGDEKTKKAAKAAINKVCRIGTHIFSFAEAVKALGGWGRATKNTFAAWYLNQDKKNLVQNLAKYQSRNGWSHRDLLRKMHLNPKDMELSLAFKWAVGKTQPEEIGLFNGDLRLIQGFELAKKVTDEKELVNLITDYHLPRECVPTQFLNSVAVWEALLMSGKGMPLTAMIRNLGKMSEIGLLKPLSAPTKFVAATLRDAAALKKARVHPLSVLTALRTYSQGHGLRGGLSWATVPQVVDALDDAFYLAFDAVEPTGKNWFLGLDVSGSMSSPFGGTNVSCAEATACLAMVTARKEPNYYIRGFCDRLVDLGITAKDTLKSATEKAYRNNFGRTDCAQPMIDAYQQDLDVDVFVVMTDNETYAGHIHPFQAMREYRQKSGRPAKLIVAGMTSTEFSIADPSDAGMMDVVGFDTSVPTLMADFAKQ